MAPMIADSRIQGAIGSILCWLQWYFLCVFVYLKSLVNWAGHTAETERDF
jgi:uncharacterized membrane protein (DUF106 family)